MNAYFYIYETVDFPIQLSTEQDGEGILKDVKDLIVSLKQNRVEVEKDITSPDIALDVENDIINFHLTQEDTSQFKEGDVYIQVNILYDDEERDTSAKGKISAFDNLHKEIMNG